MSVIYELSSNLWRKFMFDHPGRCCHCGTLLAVDKSYHFRRERVDDWACSPKCIRDYVRKSRTSSLKPKAEEFSKCMHRLGFDSYVGKMIWDMAYPPEEYYTSGLTTYDMREVYLHSYAMLLKCTL